MKTIDIDVSPTQVMGSCPKTWTEVCRHLGVSEPVVRSCRRDLGRADEPLTPDLFNEIRLMVLFTRKRNQGGGGQCTRRNFVALKLNGLLSARLQSLGILN